MAQPSEWVQVSPLAPSLNNLEDVCNGDFTAPEFTCEGDTTFYLNLPEILPEFCFYSGLPVLCYDNLLYVDQDGNDCAYFSANPD